MKRIIFHAALILTVVGILAMSACFTTDSTPDPVQRSEVNGVLEDYAAYAVAGNADAWLGLWDEGGVQMPPNAPARPVAALTQAIPAMWEDRSATTDFDMEITPIETRVGGSWAFIECRYTQNFRNRSTGLETTFDGKALTVLRQQADGSWRIYRDCFNSNTPPGVAQRSYVGGGAGSSTLTTSMGVQGF